MHMYCPGDEQIEVVELICMLSNFSRRAGASGYMSILFIHVL